MYLTVGNIVGLVVGVKLVAGGDLWCVCGGVANRLGIMVLDGWKEVITVKQAEFKLDDGRKPAVKREKRKGFIQNACCEWVNGEVMVTVMFVTAAGDEKAGVLFG